MNILMMTNTYTPLVGGIERSIRDFTAAFRRRGHRVVIATPVLEGMPRHERGVIRVPAIRRKFRGSDFSIVLPASPVVIRRLTGFHPQIIHAHQPFLIGNTALRLAHTLSVPLVYTHHVRFEQYARFLPLHSAVTQRFMAELSAAYANLCDLVFAPSESIAALLKEWGVYRPITIVPTGVVVADLARGNGSLFRKALGIPQQAFVIGHIGRLAPEKNLVFLAHALAQFLKAHPHAHCFIAGRGPSEPKLRQIFGRLGVSGRLHLSGILKRHELADAYHAMDVFAFSSKTETQGIVLIEAMAAGTPVVALDASGVREVVKDRLNGRLLSSSGIEGFTAALQWIAGLSAGQRRKVARAAKQTAASFSMGRCAQRALDAYEGLLERKLASNGAADGQWKSGLRRVKAEWDVMKALTRSAGTALLSSGLRRSKIKW